MSDDSDYEWTPHTASTNNMEVTGSNRAGKRKKGIVKRVTRSIAKTIPVEHIELEDSEQSDEDNGLDRKTSIVDELLIELEKDSEDSEDSEDEHILMRKSNKSGYQSDGFIVSDDEDEDEDADEDQVNEEDPMEDDVGLESILNNLTHGIIRKYIPNEEDKEEEVDPFAFLSTLPEEEQFVLKQEYDRLIQSTDATDHRIRILNSKMPDNGKRLALTHAQHMVKLDDTSSEYAKHRVWLETLLRIPFGIQAIPPVSLEHEAGGVGEVHDMANINAFLTKLRSDLDSNIHGQENVKEDLIALACHRLSNPNGESRVLGLQGPPGVGKTCIIKEALAPALGRPFQVIALGGATQACFLDGFDYTYEGSMPGKIINILITCGCMNPVIYFDELDKISETKEGAEIASLLIHLTDPVQSNSFEDKYFRGVSVDLSKVTFIFSFNDEHKVHPILRDRLTIIRAKGFSQADKVQIIDNYIIPKVMKDFNMTDTTFTKEAINWMVSNRITLSPGDEGVRSIKQDLQQIVTHLNVIKMAGASIGTVAPRLPCLQFPLTVTEELCQSLMRKDSGSGSVPFGMYM